ncbi:MAG: response regulator [Turicibacter sp.]
MDNFSTISKIAFNDYDIIFIDINLTSLYQADGLTLAQEIIDNGCSSKVVILTGYSKKMYEHRAKVMGAYGFLDKSVDPDELVKKLEKIYLGGKVFSDEVMVEVLTPREIEILELVRNGLTIDDVCDKVYVSKRTVSNHWPISFKIWRTNRQEMIHIVEQLAIFPGFKSAEDAAFLLHL